MRSIMTPIERMIRPLLLGIIGTAALAHVTLLSAQAPTTALPAPNSQPDASPLADLPVLHEQNIRVDELQLLIQPLPQEDLLILADQWQQNVKKNASEVALAAIVVKRATEKEQLTADESRLERLRSEQVGIVDRFRIVVKELHRKGGDATKHQSYLDAIGGTTEPASYDAAVLQGMIIDWAQSPEGGIRWLRMLGFALLILFVTWILQRFAGGAVRRIVDRQHAMSDLLKNFAVTMAGRVVWGLGAIVALGAIGVEVGPFMAAIGAGGFIIAFAMQDSLSNLFSGVMIMIYRPFDVGDFVDIAGVAGTVQHVSLVSTGLRTGDNKLLIIPNNSIWGGIITNATGADTRRVDMTFGIGYTDDVDRALDLLKQMVEEHELVLEDPAPNIRVHELADSSVNIICRPWTKTEDYWSVFWDLQQTVKKRFDAEGISIPYPQHDVHVHQV